MGSPLRVLHVVEATLGGVRRYLHGIADAAPEFESGLAYSVERSDEQFPDFLRDVRERGWSLYEVPMVRDLNPLRDAVGFRSLRRAMRDFAPDVVNCHSSKAGGIGRLAARTFGRSRPAVVYTPNALALRLGRRFEVLERILGRFATELVISVGESERDEIVTSGIVPRDKVVIVKPFIDADRFSPIPKDEARRELGIPVEQKLVVGVGRLAEQKDPATFVDLVGHLRETAPDIRALWVGDGELRGSFLERVEALRLQDVISLTGWQSDIRPFVAAGDVIVMTSLYEGLPHAMGETLAMAKPMVVTEVSGTIDVVDHGRYAALFPAGDAAAGAAQTMRLLGSREEAERMGRSARVYIEREFSKDAMREAMVTAYTHALSLRGRQLEPVT